MANVLYNPNFRADFMYIFFVKVCHKKVYVALIFLKLFKTIALPYWHNLLEYGPKFHL